MNWEEIHWGWRLAIGAAFGVLTYAGLHYFGHPVRGEPGSVAIAASVALIMFLIGGWIIRAFVQAVERVDEIDDWWIR